MDSAGTDIQQLRDRLCHVAERHIRGQAWNGLLLAISTGAVLWLTVAGIEALLWMSPLVRLAALAGVAVIFAGLVAWYTGRPALRLFGLRGTPTAEEGARLIRPAYPETSAEALTLLDLASGRRSEAPDELLQSAARQLSRRIDPVRFEDAVSYERIRERAKRAYLPVMAILAVLMLFPNPIQDASHRLLAPGTLFTPPQPFSLVITPDSAELLRGEDVRFEIRSHGDVQPSSVTFTIEDDRTGESSEQHLEPAEDGVFHARHERVRNTFHYRASADGVETAWHTAEVRQRPVVSQINVRTTPPPYSGQPPRDLPPNTGDVHDLAETTVRVQVELGGTPAEEAFLLFDDGERLDLSMQPREATASFPLQSDGHYEVHLRDADGVPNREPIRYTLRVKEDQSPRITLLSPAPTAELPETHTALLRARLQDDYGFSRLRLYYRPSQAGDEDFRSVAIPLSDPEERRQVVDYGWQLEEDSDLTLEPGQSVDYYLRVWDNDRPGGFKSARTETHRLYVPSETSRTVADDRTRRGQDPLDGAQHEEEFFRSGTDDMQGDVQRRSSSTGYERRMGDVSSRHRDLAQQTEELTRDIESAVREMERDSQRGEEALELYERLEEFSREMGLEELQQALQSMREAFEEHDPGDVQDAMEQLARTNESFRDRMERMEELLKQLQTRQQLNALADHANDLAERQEQLAEATRATSDQDVEPHAADREQLASEQAHLGDQLSEFKEQMRDAADQMQDVRGAPSEGMREMMDELASQEMSQQMEEIAQQLRSGEMDAAESNQMQMSESFQQMSEQFGDMQQQMNQQQEQLNTTAVRLALRNTLALSEQQQNLQTYEGDLSPGSDEQRAVTARQHQLREGLTVVSDTLQTLMRTVPTMTGAVRDESSHALDAMQQAVEELTGRSPTRARTHQREATGHLNTLALMLSRLLEQMQDGDGSGGGSSMEQMAQDLQDMMGDQQEMNEQIQQMLNEMQGDRLSADHEERLEQLERQHERLREQLAEARNQEGGSSDPDLDALEQAADQLEEAVADLRRDRLTPERQQEILIRLLETRSSMREQDQTPERRAELAEGTYERDALPTALPPTEPADRHHRDILRVPSRSYAPDYQQLIQRYFEQLEQRDASGD